MSKQETEDGIKWIEALVFAIADELGIQLDGLPERNMTHRLNLKMAAEVAGRRKSCYCGVPTLIIARLESTSQPPERWIFF